jgi:hypothetical protein
MPSPVDTAAAQEAETEVTRYMIGLASAIIARGARCSSPHRWVIRGPTRGLSLVRLAFPHVRQVWSALRAPRSSLPLEAAQGPLEKGGLQDVPRPVEPSRGIVKSARCRVEVGA